MASIKQRETRPIGWSLPPEQCDSKKKMGCRRAVDSIIEAEGRARNRPILLRMPRANCSSGHYLLGRDSRGFGVGIAQGAAKSQKSQPPPLTRLGGGVYSDPSPSNGLLSLLRQNEVAKAVGGSGRGPDSIADSALQAY